MDKPVGHVIYRLNLGVFAVEGEIGSAYNYILAGDGLYIQAENPHLWARQSIAPAVVRGLPGVGHNSFTIKHGRIPQRFWDLALSVFLASPEEERYMGIRWDGGAYQLYVPEQKGAESKVEYLAGEDVVCELHSHIRLGPGFSNKDDEDEKGFKIYGCIGDIMDGDMTCLFRVGVYGYYRAVRWEEIFEGMHEGVTDVAGLIDKDEEEER
jgi:hypothetical protein